MRSWCACRCRRPVLCCTRNRRRGRPVGVRVGSGRELAGGVRSSRRPQRWTGFRRARRSLTGPVRLGIVPNRCSASPLTGRALRRSGVGAPLPWINLQFRVTGSRVRSVRARSRSCGRRGERWGEIAKRQPRGRLASLRGALRGGRVLRYRRSNIHGCEAGASHRRGGLLCIRRRRCGLRGASCGRRVRSRGVRPARPLGRRCWRRSGRTMTRARGPRSGRVSGR
jgi:hypothetical protein